jgi:5-methyltetrahydropteroyltriglutamate--homocysteine methyltransferase
MITAHADTVGSLLRPPELLEAQRRFSADEISVVDFRRVEDRAVDWAIALQERAGVPVVTDGEMRRESFQSQLVEAVEGFSGYGIDASRAILTSWIYQVVNKSGYDATLTT